MENHACPIPWPRVSTSPSWNRRLPGCENLFVESPDHYLVGEKAQGMSEGGGECVTDCSANISAHLIAFQIKARVEDLRSNQGVGGSDGGGVLDRTFHDENGLFLF